MPTIRISKTMNTQSISTKSQSLTDDTHDYVFTRWMGSWERGLSLWSNRIYRDALLAYVGKIYGQQANIYHFFDQLWHESLYYYSDELDLLKTLIDRLSKVPGAKMSLRKRQETSRIDSRFGEIKCILDWNGLRTSSRRSFKISPSDLEEIIDRTSITSYFDLGCGNGLITARIGTYLGLNKENLFGGDVFDGQNEQVTFVSVDQSRSIIDLADKSVDLITCLVTLHHVAQLDVMLVELARILRPNGYLIIREHDCKLERSLPTKYLNFVHAIMVIARIGEFSNRTNDDSNNEKSTWYEQKLSVIKYTKSIRYATRHEWQIKLERIGFRHHATFDYDTTITTNPQQLFYAVYRRENDTNK